LTFDLRSQLQKSLGDSYLIERELGGGGMSRVFEAEEVRLKRKVAIKVLSPELAQGLSVERFEREIQTVAGLQQANIVPVLTAGDTDGLPFYTMPFVEGESLRAHLARGPMSITDILGVMKDVSRALAYAHQRGVVHRDIKPDNVLLSGGAAVVTDFGIAKAISAARTQSGNATLTQIGTSIGTPAYMAPEQAAGDPTVDNRADIYSLGAMIYELLCGHAVFAGRTPQRMLAAHMGEVPKPISEMRGDVPAALADLVMRCLEKEPAKRPQQASDIVRSLESITSGSGMQSMPPVLLGGPGMFRKALAIYAAAFVVVALLTKAAIIVIGLPDWVFPGALIVMALGLPMVLWTGYVQRVTRRAMIMTPTYTPGGTPSMAHGTMATMALKAAPHVSWYKTARGGMYALGTFTVLIGAFMGMRATGIGPFGSLRGKGAFGAQETLVVADFRSPANDSTLGPTVAEALRTDLAQSSSLRVLTRANVRDILGLMQRPKEGVVQFDLAREIATREGAKAVLDGEVVRLGNGYVVSARLVNALDGNELVTFRETAAGEDQLIEALGKLSRSVRERSGESLRNIQKSSELERVTTPSLAALRKYVAGSAAADELSDSDKGLALLQEAVTIDTSFAMAWRKIAVILGNDGRDAARQANAIETAFRHRDHLTDMERLLTEGYYYTRGANVDRDKAIAAYEAALVIDSTSTSALNNLGVVLGQKREWARAEEIYRRVTKLPRTFAGAYTNLMAMQIVLGHTSGLDSTRQAYRARFPNSSALSRADYYWAWGNNDLNAADSIGKASYRSGKTLAMLTGGAGVASSIAELRGQPREALKWTIIADEATYRADKTKGNEIAIPLDSVYFLMSGVEHVPEAKTAYARIIARTPLSTIPVEERNWTNLARIAYRMHDPAIAREALAGFERDMAKRLPNVVGSRAFFAAHVALTEQKWDTALALIRTADQRFALRAMYADQLLAQAHDRAGHADSAIVYYEKFAVRKDPEMSEDSQFLPGTYRRLGELYESKGNTGKALENYGKFVELWKNAEPELQPEVKAVREKMLKLSPVEGVKK
jgi:tRNA A-37 threonylcarbamoyl transferase component Bud32/tetratricopeptide (TPR) repeat protein/TolB-like protein